MASLKLRKFRSAAELEFFLNGGIAGGTPVLSGVTGLVGQGLIFTSPSATCTFTAGADPLTLTFAEIKAQIEAQITGSRVIPVGLEGRIGIIESTPTNGIALNSTGAVAKSLLGFPSAVAVAGKVYSYNSSFTAPCVVSIYFDTQSSAHILASWE